MKITFYGHACFGIETQGKNIIVDPFITPNPKASKIDIAEIKADYILLTHGHGDHVADIENIKKHNPDVKLISNYELANYFGEKDIDSVGMNHGGTYKCDIGAVKMVPAIHSSSLPDGTYGGNPGGFVLSNEESTIYIAGDTSVTMDMQLIPAMGFALDLAILPIGDLFTMDYKEASYAAELVKCDRIVGCHFDTFPPIEIDEEQAEIYFRDKGQELILMSIGQTLDV